MRTLCRAPLAAVTALAVLLPAAAAQAEPRVALVVGNSSYGALPRQSTAVPDARELGDALAALGFETTLGLDLGSEEFELAVLELAREAEGAEAAMIAYFGHGQRFGGANYLLPTDFATDVTPDVETDAVALRDAIRAAAPAEIGLVMIDAARATGLDMPGAEPGLAGPRSLPPGVVAGFSAQPGAVVADAEQGRSPYAAALVEAMGEEGLPLAGLMERVRRAVVEATGGEQRPAVFGPVEQVDFSFNPPSLAFRPLEDPNTVTELPQDRAPAGLPAPPDGEAGEAPVIEEVREEGYPGPDGRPRPGGPGSEPLLEDAAEAAPEADQAEMGDLPPAVDDTGVEIDIEPPDRADTRLEEPLAEPENPDELPAGRLPVPTEPGGLAGDVDVGEMDPETPDSVRATPDPDDLAAGPPEAREEVATPQGDDTETAALRRSPEEDPPLGVEQRKAVQRSLRLLGYYEYYIDGLFGPRTRESIRAFQERIGADPTGHLSRAQIDHLHAMAEGAG